MTTAQQDAMKIIDFFSGMGLTEDELRHAESLCLDNLLAEIDRHASYDDDRRKARYEIVCALVAYYEGKRLPRRIRTLCGREPDPYHDQRRKLFFEERYRALMAVIASRHLTAILAVARCSADPAPSLLELADFEIRQSREPDPDDLL